MKNLAKVVLRAVEIILLGYIIISGVFFLDYLTGGLLFP